ESALIGQLRSLSAPAATITAKALEESGAALKQMDASGIGVPCERYLTLARMLESLPLKVPVNLKHLFQVDMSRGAPQAHLVRAVISELERGAALTEVLSNAFEPGPLREFREFCKAFIERYQDEEVPLVEVLDEDTGIGFGSMSSLTSGEPLLRDL